MRIQTRCESENEIKNLSGERSAIISPAIEQYSARHAKPCLRPVDHEENANSTIYRLKHGSWKLGVASLVIAPIVLLPNPIGILILVGVGLIALYKLRSTRRVRNSLPIVLITISLLTSSPEHAIAGQAIPENASHSKRTSGWVCDRGYRKINGQCRALSIPKNAYATGSPYGKGWECKRGHTIDKNNACAPVIIPTNAFFTGSAWQCDRGYRRLDESCVLIELPENGFLTNSSYDTGWECIRGFRAEGATCVEILVPKGGYLSDSISAKQGWQCLRGYIKVEDTCEKIKVPANAYLSHSSYGQGWECERGYEVFSGTCRYIDVPENAHLNYSGDGWDCDRPYQERNGQCTLSELR